MNYCVEVVFAEELFVCGLPGTGGQPLSGIGKGRKHHQSQSSRAIKYLIVLGTEFAMETGQALKAWCLPSWGLESRNAVEDWRMTKSLRMGGTGDSPAMGRSGSRREQSQLK